MFIKFKSENEYLLDILYKNPQTDLGLYFKPLKKGIIVGNVVSSKEYEIIFQDSKYSYLPESSNQIDFQSYCSPLVILDISKELFSHLLKEKNEYKNKSIHWLNISQGEADVKECTIEVPTFFIDSNWYKNDEFLLSRYFTGVEISHKSGKIFSLKITAKSVFEALNLLNLIALFVHITNNYGVFTYITDDFAEKYVRILTNIDEVPYFVFYLFIKRAVKSEKQFLNFKPIFENYLNKYHIKANLTWYSTHADRINFITSQLDINTPIVDIGCGEFIYYKRIMNKNFTASYIAIDKDEKFSSMAGKMAERFKTGNLHFYTSLDEVIIQEKVNILLTEVIEHNTLNEAEKLIKQALTFNFNQIFITTPNPDFNPYYFENLKFRHDDHKFELNSKEFKSFIYKCLEGSIGLEVEFFGIGDQLNGTQPTQAVIITKN
ncbi:hypothetical protein ETU10_09635 [Apibacter muscae]|uniref:hypothetical protein n=1 Tax=Apibacter muscae TaxID=2509004 RepID=UPI0011AD7D7B|nr:hypothetical protein [Apibacter muscae]TWP22848.1 hypothetical protein ETU10_09635 [Apibacter muscae]